MAHRTTHYNIIYRSGNELGRLREDPRRLAAWAGIVGPILFVAVFTIEGFLRQGYNPLTTYISDLSIGDRGIVQILNFIVFGFLFLIFSYGVTLEFRERNLSLMGPRVFTVMAVLLILSGPLVTQPAGTPLSEMTWMGMLHNILGACFFVLGPVSCYVFWRSIRADPGWTSIRGITLAAGILLTIIVVIFSVAQKSAMLMPNVLTDWAGAIQRLDLITFFIWMVIFAWTLKKGIG